MKINHAVRRILSLLSAVILWLGANAVTYAKPGKRADANDVKCAENHFQGKRLSDKSFGGVLLWQSTTEAKGGWRDPQISTPLSPHASLTLLHFWAHWCEPCKKDFPAYAALAASLPKLLVKTYSTRARGISIPFLYLAEDTPSEAMEAFLAGNAGLIRGGVNYQDAGGQIQRDIERLLGCRISLPLTLLVDRDLRVQAAFVGGIDARRDALLDALIRLANPSRPGPVDVASASSSGGPS